MIEITEHEFVPDDDDLAAALAELRSAAPGSRIDDAGAGYAGLKQMMRVRPDIVKLDRDLIKAHPCRPGAGWRWSSRSCASPGASARSCAPRGSRASTTWPCSATSTSSGDRATRSAARRRRGRSSRRSPPRSAGPRWPRRCAPARSASGRIAAGDRRLEHLSARLASARSGKDLEGALALIAAELNADTVCLSHWHPERAESSRRWPRAAGPREEHFPLADYPLTARVLRDQEAVQVLVGDPEADPREVELLLSSATARC